MDETKQLKKRRQINKGIIMSNLITMNTETLVLTGRSHIRWESKAFEGVTKKKIGF
jgi:hypothetical protein